MKVGESVWFCKKKNSVNSVEEQYEQPIEIKTAFHHFTIMSKSGNSDILEFGLEIKNYLTAIAQPYEKWAQTFNVGDLFYCNGQKPSETEEYYGQNANYVIDDVAFGNIAIKLTLKKVVD